MPTKTKAKTKKKPAKRTPSKKKAAPKNLCVNCAPIGHTEVMAMLLVAVFGLVTVMSIANYRMGEHRQVIEGQAHQIELLQNQE